MANSHSNEGGDVGMMRTIEATIDRVCEMLEVIRGQRDDLLKAAEDLLRHDPAWTRRHDLMPACEALRAAVAKATAAVQAEAVIREANESQIVDVPGQCDLCGQEKETTLRELCDECYKPR